MKKTKCMGTSKNKRAMSGGRGKIGKYTQKFKRSYNRFVKIGDKGDDESRFKKMEEWGRMRNIYNFLKIQNDKYKGSAGTETTAWEKMNDNDDYKSAISCFEKYDNRILSKGECIPEEDYIKGNTGASYEAQDNANDVSDDAANVVSGKTGANTGAADVSGKTENTNKNAAVETDANASDADNNDNNDNTSGETDTGAAEVIPVSDAPADEAPVAEDSSTTSDADAVVQSDVSDDAVDAPVGDAPVGDAPVGDAPVGDAPVGDAPVGDAPVGDAPVGDAENDNDTNQEPPASDVSDDAVEAPVGQPKADAEAMKADTNDTDDREGGGRSKRKPRSSRRRGKSMKSKKGRKTRRKHRAGRH